METNSTENTTSTNEMPAFNPPNNPRMGRIMGGIVIVGAGLLLFARQAGAYLPEWLFSFETFLIGLGMYIWARHNFRRPGGLLLMLFGFVLLLDNIIPNLYIGQYFWPVFIIGAGLFMILSPGRTSWSRRRFERHQRWKDKRFQSASAFSASFKTGNAPTDEAYIDSTAIFGAVKKNFYTKDFKGGQVVNFMGGTEINLSQSEIQEPVTLEISQVFGGTKLILPAHWQVRSEIVAVMGGVEDKRAVHPNITEDPQRVLILRGTTVFGGIDIKSY